MIKPKKLKRGDTVAIVSLSSGTAGDKEFRHRYEQGKKRLEEVFGVKTVTMPNALKGSEYFKYFTNLSDVELLALQKSEKNKVKRKEKKN